MFSTLAVAVSFRNTTSSCFGGSMEISFLRCNDTVTSSLIVQKRLGVRGRDGRLEAVRVYLVDSIGYSAFFLELVIGS